MHQDFLSSRKTDTIPDDAFQNLRLKNGIDQKCAATFSMFSHTVQMEFRSFLLEVRSSYVAQEGFFPTLCSDAPTIRFSFHCLRLIEQ